MGMGMDELKLKRIQRRLLRLQMALEIRMWRNWYMDNMPYIPSEYERITFMALPSKQFIMGDPNTVFNEQCKQIYGE